MTQSDSSVQLLRRLRDNLYNYAMTFGVKPEEVKELASELQLTAFNRDAYRVLRMEIEARYEGFSSSWRNLNAIEDAG